MHKCSEYCTMGDKKMGNKEERLRDEDYSEFSRNDEIHTFRTSTKSQTRLKFLKHSIPRYDM